jgi:small conductance mechanosensitive channel
MVDTAAGVGYDEGIKKIKEVLLEALTSNPKVLEEPTPSVYVLELGDSSVNFAVRPYYKPEDYLDVYFATMEGTKLALDKASIEIPYPHEVRLNK